MLSVSQTVFTSANQLSQNFTNPGQTKEITNFNNFLQLLTTELKNQDPLKPLDPTQTVTQLATFSTVEQAVNTNTLLKQISEQSAIIQGSSLIGRGVSTEQGQYLGKIKSITSQNSSPFAILDNGDRVVLSSKIIIS